MELITKLKEFYDEGEQPPKASLVEVLLFFVSVLALLVYSIMVVCSKPGPQALVLIVPTMFWVFMRVSRKDMKATANLIAVVFGGVGGAIAVFLKELLMK